MTLILMGHEISRRDIGDRFVYEHDVARPLGLFAVADSALTKKQERDGEPTHYRTLLTGLRKIHEVRILVMRPDLSPSGSFEGRYFDKAYEASAFIAFAGNANSAHHALNIIRTHLEHLNKTTRRTKGQYHCQKLRNQSNGNDRCRVRRRYVLWRTC